MGIDPDSCSVLGKEKSMFLSSAIIHPEKINVDTHKVNKHRITMIVTTDNIIVEAYAPVSTAPIDTRQDYFTTLMASILETQQKHPNKPLILIEDFNSHLRGWFSETTDSSGKLLEHLAQ